MYLQKIKNYILIVNIGFFLSFSAPQPTKADIWGGDVAVLFQILSNAIQQLVRLKEIVGTAKNNLNLVRDINRGINEALNLARTVYPDQNLEIYKDWNNYQQAFRKAEAIYGHAVNSKDAAAQGHLDRSIVEAMLMFNKLSKHSKQIDNVGESIKSQSMHVSPKGAARLTAQGIGVGLHVQNQSLRTQGAILKLQAQNSAIKNKKDKDETRFFLESSKKLKRKMKNHNPQYKTPRFR
ncbi:MAG: hypothetical protein HOO06_14560 [Bdellovibrionaceae bacterium]|jgi:hypothetical protein|nr:hypothetical protein [Pseudobdellovibrionaceae bacterium]